MATDKKISELAAALSVVGTDLGVLVHAGVTYKFDYSLLVSLLQASITTGSTITFGTSVPANTFGLDGDVFFKTDTTAFYQKVSGTWTVKYTFNLIADGTVIYGSGVPSSGLGHDQYTYIDTTSGIFYLKTAGAWNQVFSMATGPQGPQGTAGTDGTNGTNGNTVLHGTTNPSNLLGVDNDFYLNTSSFGFFGPKTGGVWGAGFSLVGPGLAPGGTAGQVLSKIDGTDFNTQWINATPPVWGAITGTLSDQLDLQAALDTKVESVSITTANGISGSSSGGKHPALTLVLGAITPTSVNGVSAATMAFVDPTSSIQTQLNSKLNLSGGTLTGDIQQSAGPVNANSLINKAYADNLFTGLSWKQEVRAATTANITLSGTQTIDAVAVIVGDRVLVKNQTSAIDNGIYLVASSGWTRTTDADTPAEIGSATMLVRLGTVNKDTQWTCTNSTDPIIGTDAITFGQIAAGAVYTNGTGILLSSNVFSLDATYAKGLLSATSPIFYNSATGVISSQAASASQAGYLSSTDWSTFNGKQAALTFDSTPTSSSTNPVTSGGVFTALALKAPLANPALTGVPTAPTATVGTNTTQIATTAFVLANSGSGALLAANNLSDVASMNSSRQNLGFQTVWNRKGTVLYPSASGDQQTNGEPTIIVEGSPQLITGASSVFKCWYTQGWASPNIMYAESLDGAHWVKRSTAVVTGRNRSFVFKNGSTYIMYAANIANSQLDQLTSSDGITWTLAHSAVVTAAGFSFGSVFSPFVFIESGTWKMMLECLIGGNEVVAYLTSTDGVTWTTPGGVTNPVISTYSGGNPYVFKVGSTYYLFGHGTGVVGGTVPSDIWMQSSPDLITWSAPTKILAKQTADEGASMTNGIISDISMLQVGNSVYMYYTASTDGTIQAGIAHIKLAVANMTLAQLVTTSQGTGGDIYIDQPNFTVNPSNSNLTYTGGDNNTFTVVAPQFPAVVFSSNGTAFAAIGSGGGPIGNNPFSGLTDFNMVSSGNLGIGCNSLIINSNTTQFPKAASFGPTSSNASGNYSFASGGTFQFYFLYKGTSAQILEFANAGVAFGGSAQNSNDAVYASAANQVFANYSANSQADAYAMFSPSSKALILNGGGSFTSTGSRLQTTSFSANINATAKTGAYTLGVDDFTVRFDATGGALGPVLPTAVGCQGREYTLIKIDSSVNAVTVNTTSSQNIGTATTYALSIQGAFVRVVSNNVSWDIVGK